MKTIILSLNPILSSIFASTLTFLITALGSSIVFIFNKTNKNIMDGMLGFSAGVMIAASFFSLLNPSIDLSNELGFTSWKVLSISFLLGGFLIILGDIILNKVIKENKSKRNILLVTSIILHNIPEGAVIGVTFGSLFFNTNTSLVISSWMLAIGIGIQNFPEGCSVSLPLHRDGMSKFKSFIIGSLSAIVEPISALIGVLLVMKVKVILPFLLSFAAGSMIYVSVSELIPESQTNKNKGFITMLTLIGFTIMMILDISLS